MLVTLRYWLAYYLAYKFSGAHEKPTSDSSYYPKMANANHRLTKWLRKLEKSRYSQINANKPAKISLPTIH